MSRVKLYNALFWILFTTGCLALARAAWLTFKHW